jgi:hypothetical protein
VPAVPQTPFPTAQQAAASVASPNADIAQLILDDHHTMRLAFARLDDLSARNDPAELAEAWHPLAEMLDVHAIAEEEVFYPQLLVQVEDAEDETVDAIGDHNDIRDGVRDANREPVGSAGWWDAVRRTRVANDHHMAEEEREGLALFRKDVEIGLRDALGRRFLQFKAEHPTTRQLDTDDKDPELYVAEHEPDGAPQQRRSGDGTLGIGSLRGR